MVSNPDLRGPGRGESGPSSYFCIFSGNNGASLAGIPQCRNLECSFGGSILSFDHNPPIV